MFIKWSLITYNTKNMSYKEFLSDLTQKGYFCTHYCLIKWQIITC